MRLRICLYVCKVCERSFYFILQTQYTRWSQIDTCATKERIQYMVHITGQFLLLIKLFLNRKYDPVSWIIIIKGKKEISISKKKKFQYMINLKLEIYNKLISLPFKKCIKIVNEISYKKNDWSALSDKSLLMTLILIRDKKKINFFN